MQFFVWGRDRPGGFAIKTRLNEEHWSFMDGYADQLIARGPTLTGHGDDAETTGSLHIVDLPDEAAVRRFAFDEPYHQAGAFEAVDIYRFHNHTGRTMWDFGNAVPSYHRYLLVTTDRNPATPTEHFILHGDLYTVDDRTHVGQAALVEAPGVESAATLLPSAHAHPWEFGGRR